MGRRVHDRRALGRRRRRLRAHRDRRVVDRSAATASATSPSTWPRRAWPGGACASTARRATARCPTAPTTRSITSAEIIRRLVAFRPRAQPRRPVDGPHRLDGPARRPAGPRSPTRPASPTRWPALPTEYARAAHACSHTTISPNVIHGGQKTNTIPDVIDIDVDIRTVPGDTREVVDGYYAEILGELADRVEISPIQEFESTRSPIGNPLWDALRDPHPGRLPRRRPRARASSPVAPTPASTAPRVPIAYGTALFSPADDDGDVRHPVPRQRRARRRRVARAVDRVLARHRQGDRAAERPRRRPVSRLTARRPTPDPFAVDELGRRHEPGPCGDAGRCVVLRDGCRR